MAAYEILLLNTAIPQIQAAQSGDTYVVPRDIAFSAALTLSAGTANGVPYLNASKVLTTGSALTFDGSALNITVSSGNAYSVLTGASTLGAFTNYKNATADHYIGANNNFGSLFGGVGGANSLALTTFGNLPIGFGINSSEQMRLTSTGLGIGTNNPGAKLDVNGTIYSRTGGVYTDTLTAYSGSSISVNAGSSYFAVSVNGAERARITSAGQLLVGATSAIGAERFLVRLAAAAYVGRLENDSTTAADCFGLFLRYGSAAPNGTGNLFLRCDDSAATRAEIRSNGGLANYQSNNVDLSDIRTKTDINPLASYWDKIAALEIVTYKYKDQTHDDLNIGVIAQQVEQVAPEFVDPDGFGETPEDGVPLKTIYNKDLTFAAIKALQEAMARIEKLEAEVAALKGA